jgi:hypothetical protein
MAKKGYADVLEKKDPTKAVPREEQIGRNHQKLAESDRRGLADQIARKENEIREKLDLNPDADVSEMTKDMNDKKMILHHDDDLTPKSDGQRDRLAARAKELQDYLGKKMPNKREMNARPGTTESAQAVRHNLKFQEECDPMCREYQDIQKKLNPDDPNAQSLELIRPD